MNPHSERLRPPTPIEKLTRPFVKFLHIQSMGGIVLACATVVALFAANSGWAEPYQAFWNRVFRIGIDGNELAYPLWYWINDALMALFFFVVGLEIKRELAVGELRDRRRVVLPVVAALGGAIVPAGIYLALQYGQPGQNGWAIPMATDIAFVVGCLAILGDRVPHGLKVWMLSLAIVDDIMAVLVIALFYTSAIKLAWIAVAAGCVAVTVAANRLGVRSIGVYVVLGVAMWYGCLKSGVHPTIAGVILGLLTPANAWLDHDEFKRELTHSTEILTRDPVDSPARRAALFELVFASREAMSPLVRLETALHPWVAFVVMPIFALANAGGGGFGVSVPGSDCGGGRRRTCCR